MKNQMHHSDLKLLKNLSVLYVEDDPVVGLHTISLLEHFFRKIFHCGSAEEALQLLKNETVHLVITDIELPGKSGLELCKAIRERDREIPIFITSMHNHKGMLREAIKLNLVDYLIKPISIPSMTRALLESVHRMKESGNMAVQINSQTSYFPILGKLESSGNEIPLTHSEFLLLNLLLRHQNKVVDRTVIEHLVSPDECMSEPAYKNLIYRLRKKIGKENIVSVSGVGIKLVITDKKDDRDYSET